MRQATLRHRPAIPDLDPQGRYHPHTLMRLGVEAVAAVKRDAGVLQTLTEAGRVHDYQLTYHAPAGRDDELEITAKVDEITATSVKFAFSITASGRPVATGAFSEVFEGADTDAPVPDDVQAALIDLQGRDV